MVPFYAARVSDLGPGDFVQVECACGHTERLMIAMLSTAGLAPHERFRGWKVESAVENAMRRGEP